MSALQLFDVEGANWRFGQDHDGTPWAVATDVARSFDYRDAEKATRLLDEDEKGTRIVGTPGGPQELAVIYEDGLWELVFLSRKPEAKAIKKRVKAILKEIRETGSYAVPSPLADPLAEIERQTQLTTRAIGIARQERARADAADRRAGELEPDAARAQRTLDAHGVALVGTVAKRFAIQEKALREFLYGEKLLIRGGARHNEPYAEHVKTGHFELKTRLVEVDPDRPAQERSTTYVTPKGEALIWKRLFAAGMVSSPRMPAPPAEQLQLGA